MSAGPATSERAVVAGRYRVVRPLGTGAHGVVDLAEDLLDGDRPVALKRIEGIFGAGEPDPAAERLRWFRHPRWAEVLDEGRYGDHGRFQVTRYVPGTCLDALEGPQPVEDVWRFLEDGARVLRALHVLGLVHYDVTPGNWLREETPEGAVFTLTDGGLASLGPVRGIARGTPLYMAPELTENRPHDHRVDLYSLGLVAWRMATGRVPWEGGAGEVLGGRRRERCPSARDLRPDLPVELDRVLAELLEREPAQRTLDALSLLKRIESALGRPVPVLTVDEGIAAAASGPIVGREEEIARFRRACRLIASSESVPSGTASLVAAARHGADSSPDPVLLVHGPSGSGATRLLREFAAIARSEDLACLAIPAPSAIAAQDSWGQLLASFQSLRKCPQEREQATSAAHSVERFVRLCEEVGSHVPIVLLVENFPTQPSLLQESISALSRHLLARAEHPAGRAPAHVILVVDHGDSPPSQLCLADSSRPEHPVVRLGTLTDSEIQALISSRFPGAAVTSDDLERFATSIGRLPGFALSGLAEATWRGFLRPETLGWSLDMLSVLATETGAGTMRPCGVSLRSLPASQRQLATHLAVLGTPLPMADCKRLVSPVVHLDSRFFAVGSGPQELVALRNLALQQSLRASTSKEAYAASRDLLVSALSLDSTSDVAIEIARLMSEQDRHADALDVLLTVRPWPGDSRARERALAVAVRCCTSAPDLVTPDRSLLLAQLLFVSPVASTLARALGNLPLSFQAGRLLLEYYLASREHRAAEGVARQLLVACPPATSPLELAALHVSLARAAAGRSTTAFLGREALLAAAVQLRRAGRQARRPAETTRALYALTRAQDHHYAAAYSKSCGASRRALRLSRSAGDPQLRSHALNNLAIALWHLGRHRAADRLLRRSYDAKLRLGDLLAATNTLHNLGRFLRQKGQLLPAAAAHMQAVNLATRFALHDVHARGLENLASIYDEQLNPALATEMLERAQMVAERAGLQNTLVRCARRLASVAVLSGRIARARKHLLTSAIAARRGSTEEQAEHFLASAEASHHLGQAAATRRKLALAKRCTPASSCHDSAALLHLAQIESRGAAPRRHWSRVRAARRTATRRSYQYLLACHRAMTHGSGRPWATLLGLLTAPSHRLLGGQQRLLVTTLLRAIPTASLPASDRSQLLGKLADHFHGQGLALAAARAHAARALVLLQTSSPLHSGDLVSVVGALEEGGFDYWASRTGARLPSELGDLAAALRKRLGPTPTTQNQMLDLYVLCQRFGAASSHLAHQDTRLAAALRRVLGVAERFETGAGLEKLLESLTRYGLEVTGAERCCLVLLKADSQLEVRVESAASSADGSKVPSTRFSHTVIRRVLASRQPVLIHDVFGDDDLMERPSIATLALRSVLCVPIARGEQMFGVMYADNAAAAGSFDSVDLEVLTLFARQAAAAIDASRLLADSQRSYGELKSLQERLLRGERLRVIGEMTSGVAHEFNNLLTAILARIQLLELDEVPASVRDHLRQIEHAAEDAASVVKRLQNFARNQRQGEFRTVDVAALCGDVVELLRPLWANRRLRGLAPITVQTRFAKQLQVRGDPTELREVVTNLLKNSIEALEAGGTVALTAERTGHRVRIQVSDNGPGIAEADLPRIFIPFFTTKGERGTGLGLSLAQQIVDRHGGELMIESTFGHGATATAYLPEDGHSPAATANTGRGRSMSPPDRSVIVVDDDPDVLAVLSTYLERCGYSVRAAATALEALANIEKQAPDVVISDIAMPGMDGLELCRRLQARCPQVPVVLMSGQATGIDPERIRHAGAYALLAKPFTMRQVIDLINEAKPITARGPT